MAARRSGPTRAQVVRGAAAAALTTLAARAFAASPPPAKIQTRPIPSTREPLPVIGCGTYVGFDQSPGSPGYAELPAYFAPRFEDMEHWLRHPVAA